MEGEQRERVDQRDDKSTLCSLFPQKDILCVYGIPYTAVPIQGTMDTGTARVSAKTYLPHKDRTPAK